MNDKRNRYMNMINLLNAKEVLVMADLPEKEKFWKDFYFNNVSLIRERTGGELPEFVTWGQLKRVLYRAEENQQFESCMEYSEMKRKAEHDADSEVEYSVEEFDCEKETGIEAREAVNEEGPPWDDDYECKYRNKLI